MTIYSLKDEKEKQIKNLSKSFELLARLDQMSEREKRDRIDVFMVSLGRLFLSYFQYDLKTAREVGQEIQEVLQDNRIIFMNFVVLAENILTDFESGEEWGSACIERTRIEAFNEMFKGIAQPLDTQEFEEMMQKTPARHKCVNFDDIPKNVPSSHWWWFV